MTSRRYDFKTEAAARREIDRRIATHEVAANLLPGDHVRFSGSRSSRWNPKVYREVVEVKVHDGSESTSYENPDHVEFDRENLRYGSPEYEAAVSKFRESTTTLQREAYLFLSVPCRRVTVVSRNVYPGGREDVVYATNDGSTLSEVERDGRWVPIRELISTRRNR